MDGNLARIVAKIDDDILREQKTGVTKQLAVKDFATYEKMEQWITLLFTAWTFAPWSRSTPMSHERHLRSAAP